MIFVAILQGEPTSKSGHYLNDRDVYILYFYGPIDQYLDEHDPRDLDINPYEVRCPNHKKEGGKQSPKEGDRKGNLGPQLCFI